jgi:hypothetical protein
MVTSGYLSSEGDSGVMRVNADLIFRQHRRAWAHSDVFPLDLVDDVCARSRGSTAARSSQRYAS